MFICDATSLFTAATRWARHTYFRTPRRGNALLESSMPSTDLIKLRIFGGLHLETDLQKDHSSNRFVLSRRQNGSGNPVSMISKTLHYVRYEKGICRRCHIVRKKENTYVFCSAIISAKHSRNGRDHVNRCVPIFAARSRN